METEQEERKKSREEFVVKIGPGLREVLDVQKENIKEVTYDCVKASDYSAGEIIAKKIVDNELL